MSKSIDVIVSELLAHVKKCGGALGQFYAGIAKDPKKRLFNDHAVNENNGCWAYRTASSANDAREAEKRLLAAGLDGGDGGGDAQSTAVYIYKKTSNTTR